jgi:catechol 2,3-dioxygenase-like lactoylglutathione lyase family enzyme
VRDELRISSMKLSKVLETCLYASDLKKAEEFYSKVLGLEVITRVEDRHVFFRCGDQVVLIFNPEQTIKAEQNSSPVHGAKGPGHIAFQVSKEELAIWKNDLESKGIVIEHEARWGKEGRSIYFRDPAGNSLELATPETWRMEN